MAKTVKPSTSTPLQRVAMVGTSGSGKTRLAEAIARKLAVPHSELDALFWEAGWQSAPRETE